jgi:hypothetical protein
MRPDRPIPRLVLLGLLPALPGCNITSYFSTVASEALLLGVADPVEGVDLGAAATATTFLAKAQSLDSVAANVFDDADRVWIEGGGGEAELPNQGDGLYLATSEDDADLVYADGSRYTLHVQNGGKSYSVGGEAPPPPQLDGVPAPPATHAAGTQLVVDLSGQGFDNFVGVVADSDGNLTWDSRPEDAGGYVDWIRDSGEVTTVTVPGSAFPDPGQPYVLGLAGVVKAPDADFEGFNPLVSNFALGSLAVATVTTAP